MKEQNTSLIKTEQPAEIQRVTDAKTHMEQAFVSILTAPPTHDLQWTGTKTDLMEIIYAVYLDGLVIDNKGCPATFTEIARRACSTLHVALPSNPRAYTCRARSRKGFRQRPFIERYARMMARCKGNNPLFGMIREYKA